MEEPTVLDLNHLAEQVRLSRKLVECYVEAASVVLDRFHTPPPPPTAGTIAQGQELKTANIEWTEPDLSARESHANQKDAVEYGAYAMAFAAMQAQGYRLFRRTHQGSGCDFVMLREGEPDNDFFKLEVSGTIDIRYLAERLREKVDQGKGGDLDRPGAAVVVAFDKAHVAIEEWR